MMLNKKLKSNLELLGFCGISDIPKLKEIRLAYYRLAKIHHPDKNPGANDETKEELENNFKMPVVPGIQQPQMVSQAFDRTIESRYSNVKKLLNWANLGLA